MSIRACLVSLLLLLTAETATGEALEERDWKLVTSPNFRVHSVLDLDRTRELVRHLEAMRLALDDPASESTYADDVPTVILAIDSVDDYENLGAPVNTEGVFVADLRENAILFVDTQGELGIEVVLHEYAHYLNFKNGDSYRPRWFEEGSAQYYSASRLTVDGFEYGIALPSRIAALNFANWLPVDVVLKVTDMAILDEIGGELFYLQSWLLYHYLQSRVESPDTLNAQLQLYNQAMTRDGDPISAFQNAFDVEVGTLAHELTEYVRGDEFHSRTAELAGNGGQIAPRVEPVSQQQVLIELGQMALRFENARGAEGWFRAALLHDDVKHLAEAGIGRVLGYRGDTQAANEHFESAIYHVSWDFRVWMDYAQFWATRIATTTDVAGRRKHARKLKEALESALTISDATPELSSLMGLAELALGKDPKEAIPWLEDSVEGAPMHQVTRLLLARAYLWNGEYHKASGMARSVLLLEHQQNVITETARELIREADHEGSRND